MNVIKANGLYFVAGKGFVVKTPGEATQVADGDVAARIACAKDLGIVAVAETLVVNGQGIIQNADGTSFAVSFIRPKDLNGDGSIKNHKLNPSRRRFRTKAEALRHAARYVGIEGHLGYYVTGTHDPVNAWVNNDTGFTNPELALKNGKPARLGRQAKA